MTAYPPPGRNPPGPDERLLTQTRRAFGGGADGGSRWGLPVTGTDPISQPYQVAGWIVIVYHDDDPNVERPDAVLVRWAGVATPNYAKLVDDHIRMNIPVEDR